MKKVLLLSIIGIFLIFFISLFSQEFTYVGAGKCKICHKTEKQGKQFPLWEERKHSKSFAPLTTEEVKAKVPDAAENPECLKCHAPLFEKAAEFKEEGVTCEVCKGLGMFTFFPERELFSLFFCLVTNFAFTGSNVSNILAEETYNKDESSKSDKY